MPKGLSNIKEITTLIAKYCAEKFRKNGDRILPCDNKK